MLRVLKASNFGKMTRLVLGYDETTLGEERVTLISFHKMASQPLMGVSFAKHVPGT